MKIFLQGLFAALVAMVLWAGCARVEKVKAVEGDRTTTPYESLGTLEVKEKARFISFSNVLGGAAEHYKKSLRAKLADTARTHYGADGVIKVEYWPDPQSKRFPYGYIYARGEMIKYRKFPASTSSEEPSAQPNSPAIS